MILRTLILLSSINITAIAGELHGPHTHGEMEVLPLWAADQHLLILEIVAPAKDLIGYERDPDSAREKKALRDFDENFDPLKLFIMNDESQCLFKDGRSSSDMFSAAPHKHGVLDKTHSHPVGIDGHVDFKLIYRFECKAIPSVSFDLFDTYPSLKRINIRKDSITGDVVERLTKIQNTFTLTP